MPHCGFKSVAFIVQICENSIMKIEPQQNVFIIYWHFRRYLLEGQLVLDFYLFRGIVSKNKKDHIFLEILAEKVTRNLVRFLLHLMIPCE